MLQLTQKETMLLKDAMSHEETCITKYNEYAQKVEDQQLKNMFNQHAQKEQEHYNTLNQILSGVVPNMGGSQGQQNQQNQNQQQNQSQQGMQNNQGMQNQANSNDKYYCTDLLSTEKYISGTYDTFIFEMSNPQVRQALQHIQKEEQKHGEDIFNYMSSHGMYQTQ